MYREAETQVYEMMVRGEKPREIRVSPNVHELIQDEWRQITGNYGETLDELCNIPLEIVRVPGMGFEVRV